MHGQSRSLTLDVSFGEFYIITLFIMALTCKKTTKTDKDSVSFEFSVKLLSLCWSKDGRRGLFRTLLNFYGEDFFDK